MSARQSVVRLQFKIADDTLRRALRHIDDMENSLEDWAARERELVRAAQQSAAVVDKQASVTAQAARQTTQAAESVELLARNQRRLEKDAERATDALREQARAVDVANERYDRVNQDVGLAGDVESNLLAIGGLGGAAGLQTEGIAALGDVFATLEALPRLGAAVRGLPSTIASAAQALGPTGVGLGAVLIGIGAIVAGINAQVANLRAQVAGAIEANQDYYRAIAEGQTTVEAQAEVERQRREAEIARAEIERLRAVRNEAESGVTGAIAGRFFSAFEDIDAAIADAEQRLGAANTAIDLYSSGLEANVFAANDAAAASRELNEAYDRATAAAQAYADSLIDTEVSTRLALRGLDAEGISTRIADIGAEIEILRDVLQDPTLSPEARQAYENRIGLLERELTLLQQAAPAAENAAIAAGNIAALSDNLQALGTTSEQAAQAQKDYAEQVAAAAKSAADAQVAIAEERAKAETDALKKLLDKRADLAQQANKAYNDALIKYQQDNNNLLIKFQRDEVTRARDHAREIRDIRERQQMDEIELLERGDFLGLARLRRENALDLTQRNRAFNEESSDRAEQLQQQQSDLATAFNAERQQRIMNTAEQLRIAQAAYDAEIQQAQQNEMVKLTKLRMSQQAENAVIAATQAQRLGIMQQGKTQELQVQTLSQQAALTATQQFYTGLVAIANDTAKVVSFIQTNLAGFSAAASLNPANIPGINADFAGLPGFGVGGGIPGLNLPGLNLPGFAAGGAVNAGQAVMVNELGRESFGGAQFPPGLGVFIPARSGTITPAAGGMTFQQTINVSNSGGTLGADALGIIQTQTKQLIEGAFRAVLG